MEQLQLEIMPTSNSADRMNDLKKISQDLIEFNKKYGVNYSQIEVVGKNTFVSYGSSRHNYLGYKL